MRISILIFFSLLFYIVAPAQAVKNKKPNVVIILADDLGWADLSCYGSSFYETPNLDKLASMGIRFTQAYANSPVCSPTRASLMTGKMPVKTGVTDWIPGRHENGKARSYEKMVGSRTANQLPLGENTIAEQLQKSGYKTFFAGKWHLGEEEKFWPEYQGFQTNIGGWSKGSPTGKKNDSTGGFFTPYQNPRLSDGPPGEYLTDRLTNECIRFIEANKNEPFLLMYSLYAVHNPLQAPAALVKKYERKRAHLLKTDQSPFLKDEPWMQFENGWKRRVAQENPVYAAMVENMDNNIGRIIAKLKEAGIDDNTVIIFTSDNGGLSTAEGSPTMNGPLRAGKGWLYEGGIRVPFIMYWKGKLLSNFNAQLPMTVADIFPTVAKLADDHYVKDASLDGENIIHLLADSLRYKSRPLYWHYPHYSNQGGRPGAAIREGNWKLIYHYEDQSIELYDVVNDVGEKRNMAGVHQETAASLKKKLLNWLRDVKASSPVKNQEYIPHYKSQTTQIARPNIIVILADDAGYADFGFMGSKDIKTPHLDRLAKDGVLFTQNYTTSSVCSPSRAGLLTGRYQQQFGHECNLEPGQPLAFDTAQTTIAEALKRQGYQTAIFGKWHLGDYKHQHPLNNGFDSFWGFIAGGRHYFQNDKDDKPGSLNGILHDWTRDTLDGYLTDVLGEKSAAYIGQSKTKPFFLYLAFNAPHTPMDAKPDVQAQFEGKSSRPVYAAMMWSMDQAVGKVISKLKETGQYENTLIFFLSDNGGAHNNGSSVAPLKGWKGNEYEGGIRVPMIVSWPSMLKGNKTFRGISSSLDIFITSVKAAGGHEKEYHADGKDLIPYLQSDNYSANVHNELYWRKDQVAAARIGDHKLIRLDNGQRVSYNLSEDQAEQKDMIQSDTTHTKWLLENLYHWETKLKKPVWIEPKAWNTVTRSIVEDLMNNRPVRYREPADLKKKSSF